MFKMIIEVMGQSGMQDFGARLGAALVGGEVLQLVGDVGAGKTTLTKGVARGLGIDQAVQSPSFTISRVYDTPAGLQLAHYDFYRLNDAGIMADELAETTQAAQTVTILEWADVVSGVLPKDHLKVELTAISDNIRRVELSVGGDNSRRLLEALQ